MELRHGYKQTEVGVIPEEWDTRPLLAAVHVATGQVDPKREPYSSMVLVAPDHVESETGRLLERRTASEQGAISGKYVFNPGDIVYSKIRPYLRKAIHASFQGLCSADMYPLTAARDVSAAFVFAVLLGHHFSTFASNVSARSGIPKINREELGQYVLALPPLREQRAIAAVLGDVDALLGALEKLIAKKRGLKQAAMQQLLTGQKRLPGFSGEWEVRHIGSFSSFVTKGATPTTYGFNWEDEGILFLRSECVAENGLDLAQSKFVSGMAHAALIRGEVRSRDILITITGNVGRVVHLNPDFGIANINQHIARIRVKDPDVLAAFVFHWLSQPSVRAYYTSITTGQAYPQISLKQVRETRVPIPSLPEQTAIAAVLSDMDAEIAALEARLAKARALKQGMMQELLTGKTRLM